MSAENRSTELVKLATVQRIVRAQSFDGPTSFAHFTLFGLVSAGRDTGALEFERSAALEHASIIVDGILAAGADDVRFGVTDFTGGALSVVVDAIHEAHGDRPGVSVVEVPDRTAARGYCDRLAIVGSCRFGDGEFEVADGGLVDWSQLLVGSRKERMMISGIGVDRLALGRAASPATPDAAAEADA